MSRRRLLITLVASGALVGLLIWLPARVFGAILPAGVQCSELSGSVWAGQCAGLSIRGSRSGEVRWHFYRPQWQPFIANIGFVWTPRGGATSSTSVAGVIAARLDGRLVLQINSAQLSLQALRDAMPADLTLGPLAALAGKLESHGLLIELDERRQLAALRGAVELRGTRLLRFNTAVGDFVAEFAGVTGRIKDQGGPLMLAGEARLTEPGAYEATLRIVPKITGLLPTLPGGTPLEISVDGRL